jgi:glutamate-1-semialdehyde aminotransferase
MPEDLAEKADIIARGRGISVNALMLEALQTEINTVKGDAEFMGTLRRLTERDKEILDRLAE